MVRHCSVVRFVSVRLCGSLLFDCAVRHCSVVRFVTVRLCRSSLFGCAVRHCSVVRFVTVRLCGSSLFDCAVRHCSVVSFVTEVLSLCGFAAVWFLTSVVSWFGQNYDFMAVSFYHDTKQS